MIPQWVLSQPPSCGVIVVVDPQGAGHTRPHLSVLQSNSHTRSHPVTLCHTYLSVLQSPLDALRQSLVTGRHNRGDAAWRRGQSGEGS